jgi:hypothetical protein
MLNNTYRYYGRHIYLKNVELLVPILLFLNIFKILKRPGFKGVVSRDFEVLFLKNI